MKRTNKCGQKVKDVDKRETQSRIPEHERKSKQPLASIYSHTMHWSYVMHSIMKKSEPTVVKAPTLVAGRQCHWTYSQRKWPFGIWTSEIDSWKTIFEPYACQDFCYRVFTLHGAQERCNGSSKMHITAHNVSNSISIEFFFFKCKNLLGSYCLAVSALICVHSQPVAICCLFGSTIKSHITNKVKSWRCFALREQPQQTKLAVLQSHQSNAPSDLSASLLRSCTQLVHTIRQLLRCQC